MVAVLPLETGDGGVQLSVVEVKTIAIVFIGLLPLNRVAELDVIVKASVSGPRDAVAVTWKEPDVPAGIAATPLMVMGKPTVGVRVKLK